MVLDAKALTWAAQNNIDTAKLKAAKIPIYGKWYFPDIPSGVPLVNLETGERQTFPERMFAGEVIFAPESDLRRAGLLPGDFPEPEPSPSLERGLAETRALAPEPLLAVARPIGVPRQTTQALAIPQADEDHEPDDPSVVAGIHMPLGSIAPLVLGVGFAIAFVGLITSVFVVIVGLIWMLVGAIGWIRIGQIELGSAGHHREADH
jgi:hypothetical protein